MRYPRLTWVVVLGLALTSWWLGEREPAQADPVLSQSTPREVDYYLRGLSATTMNPQGTPARTLDAAELHHFPQDDTTELTRPRLTVHQEEGPPWLIVSETGWVSSDGSLVLLNGDVRITREQGEKNRPVQLDTRNLRVQPHQDYAETDEKVRVRSNLDRIDATGMQAWLRPPARIKLQANVKGYYAPP